MNNLQRIIIGHVAVGTLTSSYTIKNFPRQSDQGLLIPWACNTLVPNRRVREPLSGNKKYDGSYTSHIEFKLMTYGMYDYWLDSFMPSDTASGLVTVMLYDKTNTAVFLQMTISQPVQLNQVAPGYRDVIFPLTFGTIIT